MHYAYMDRVGEKTSATERRTDGRRWITRGGLAYVTAWIVGVALKPAGVTSADDGATIAGNYIEHRAASIVQVLLVHAVAAVALLVFAIGLARLAERSRLARWCRRAVSVIVLTSLVQAVLGVVTITTAGQVASTTTRGLLIAVERLDAVKLAALAGLCAVGWVLARRGTLPRWTGRVAAGAIVCLLAGAVALTGVVPALAPMAVPALVLLLAWVGSVGLTTRRAGA